MIEKFEIKGVHTTVDEKLRKYVNTKIGRLDKYLPRHHRDSVHVVVELKEGKAKNKNRFTCEVNMHLPHEDIRVCESTVNIYAAVDIVENKLKQQIKKYKESRASGKWYRHLAARFRRRSHLMPEQLEVEV